MRHEPTVRLRVLLHLAMKLDASPSFLVWIASDIAIVTYPDGSWNRAPYYSPSWRFSLTLSKFGRTDTSQGVGGRQLGRHTHLDWGVATKYGRTVMRRIWTDKNLVTTYSVFSVS